jgi:hypothetical protein
MAGGGVLLTSSSGKDYPGKLTMFVLITCIVAATGGLIFGYDIGISGELFFISTELMAAILHDIFFVKKSS